jgi:acetyltransferase
MVRHCRAPALMRVKARRRPFASLRAMTHDLTSVRRRVLDAIHAVAPEADVDALAGDRPLRDAIDLDSLDWINVIAGLEQRLDIEIPPVVLPRLSTVNALVACIASLPHRPRSAAPAGGVLPCRTYVVHGVPVVVRPLCAEDMPLEEDFMQRLSSLSRYKRFMVTLNELPAGKLWSLTHVDQTHHVALAAVVLVDGAPALAGVARYVVDASAPACEFALEVDDAWQGSGLAGILMHLLVDVARARGLARMEGWVLRTNDRMLKLGRQLGFERVADPEDRDTVRIVLPL